ncbi:MAG: DNA mismatch repair endonuclease MutL [Clostridia bacterium]|nr:DNA mismatch repair endonuclease MutL [Clostridia bacterium]
MGKVKLLDKHTAELIAAGEVVERPSSVVKELVENCIDAHATVITVEIRHGGAAYIRVTDNGEGMAPDDVPTAFLRHATSKIRTGEDLDCIATLGFRGEALASICAVSKLDLITRTADSDEGVHYRIEGSDEVMCEPTGCAVGTTIIVREMFYNTPARRKFLKSDKAEGNAIAAVIDRVALSHPEISFRFLRDGREALLTPGDGKLKSAVHAVLGREFTAGLLPVQYEYNAVRVEGFLSRPTQARPNRSMQIFFINGRYVRSRTMQNALEEACKGAVMIGKYPACVLGISLDCSAVDVNVHPAKLEVRFTNERPVYEAVYFAVKSSLSTFDSPREMELPQTRRVNAAPNMHEYKGVQVSLNDASPIPAAPPASRESSTAPTVLPPSAPERPAQPSPVLRPSYGETVRQAQPEIHGTLPPAPVPENDTLPDEPAVTEALPVQTEPQPASPVTPPADSFLLPDYRIVGELFDTYILIESGGELILIDKHAAHERLIFERLMRHADAPESQMLLSPLPVTLDKQQYDAVTEHLDLLAQAGFEAEDFGTGTVILRSVPTILSGQDAEDAFLEIAGKLGERLDAVTTDYTEWIYHTIACKSAVKGGDKNTLAELSELVLTLIHHPDVRYCPHGRPIYVSLTRREIEKYFGRIQS